MASRIFDGHVRERTAPVFRASRSLTTCCVIVDPPSLTRPVTRVAPRRARDGDRIDTRMAAEPRVLRGDRRGGQWLRQRGGVNPRASRSGARARLVNHLAVPIDDHRRGAASSSSSPAGSGPIRTQRARTDRAAREPAPAACDRARRVPSADRQATKARHLTTITDWRRPSVDLGRVHLFRPCARDVERSSGRRAHQIRELVPAFTQPCGEERDAIVVFLDAVEAAPAPAGAVRSVLGLRRGVARQVRGRRPEPAVDGLDAAGERVGDGHEPAFFRQRDRQRDADQIPGSERRRRRTAAAAFDEPFEAALDAHALVARRRWRAGMYCSRVV